MFLLDSLLIDGLGFVLDKLRAVAEDELRDDKVLRERLLDAQMRLELGELTTEEFTAIEREVFDRLRELRGSRPAALSMKSRDAKVSVETTVADDLR
jgi:gas vesicle protein GvpG